MLGSDCSMLLNCARSSTQRGKDWCVCAAFHLLMEHGLSLAIVWFCHCQQGA